MSRGGRAPALVNSTEAADGRIEIWAAEDPKGRTYFQLRLVGFDGIPLMPRWLDEVNFALKAVRQDAP